jgi:small subunit ribosomal protein S16
MVKIRLMRMGKKKQPYFRVVVADARSPRDGRFIENIGRYHPREHPSVIDIDEDRALHWLKSGAQPSDPVKVLFVKTGIWSRFTGEEPPPVEQPPQEAPAEAAAPAESAPEAVAEPAGAEAETEAEQPEGTPPEESPEG